MAQPTQEQIEGKHYKGDASFKKKVRVREVSFVGIFSLQSTEMPSRCLTTAVMEKLTRSR